MHVCGFETVSVSDSSEWFKHTQMIIEPNYLVYLSEFTSMFATNSTLCGIESFELRASLNTPLADESTSPSWASWIKINDLTKMIYVNHDQVIGSLANNTEVSMYLMAVSKGKSLGSKKLKFKFTYPETNYAPAFTETLVDLTFSVSGNNQTQGEAERVDLPEIEDVEMDQPLISAKFKELPPCQCLSFEVDEKKGTVAVVLDKSKVSGKDIGVWKGEIEIKDESG